MEDKDEVTNRKVMLVIRIRRRHSVVPSTAICLASFLINSRHY